MLPTSLNSAVSAKNISAKEHWESVYSSRPIEGVSWFRPHLEISFAAMVRAIAAQSLSPATASILDVGGGASTLIDDLLEYGCRSVTVLDIAPSALEAARLRLGTQAALVHWLCADILDPATALPTVDIWHDRAVFHFLVEPPDRERYISALRASLRIGGHLVLSTFGPEGPERCSGLPTRRYSHSSLARELGAGFTLLDGHTSIHQTPSGATQQFTTAHLRRNS